MTTQTIHAPHLHQGSWTIPGLQRLVSAFWLILEAYSEALDQAYTARRRYPYASE